MPCSCRCRAPLPVLGCRAGSLLPRAHRCAGWIRSSWLGAPSRRQPLAVRGSRAPHALLTRLCPACVERVMIPRQAVRPRRSSPARVCPAPGTERRGPAGCGPCLQPHVGTREGRAGATRLPSCTGHPVRGARRSCRERVCGGSVPGRLASKQRRESGVAEEAGAGCLKGAALQKWGAGGEGRAGGTPPGRLWVGRWCGQRRPGRCITSAGRRCSSPFLRSCPFADWKAFSQVSLLGPVRSAQQAEAPHPTGAGGVGSAAASKASRRLPSHRAGIPGGTQTCPLILFGVSVT